MLEIGSSIGRYHILEQLGEGGMATVYKAYDTRLERDVAFKVIRTDAFPPAVLERVLKRFEREALSLARLSHPNIVKVYDFGEFNGAPYLVMEYIPGGTLKQLSSHPLPWNRVVNLLIPIADALAYAHEEGILHRDVKPANIILARKGQPILTDFGIAKLLEEDGGATLTGTGVGVGTPEYMAPEQGMGREIDGRADVYALGVVLYELVTGRKPYTADTPMAVIVKHLTDPLPRPKVAVPDLPERIEQIIFKAMAKKPEDRYQSMEDFSRALSEMIHNEPSSPTAADSSLASRSSDASVAEDETGELTFDLGADSQPLSQNTNSSDPSALPYELENSSTATYGLSKPSESSSMSEMTGETTSNKLEMVENLQQEPEHSGGVVNRARTVNIILMQVLIGHQRAVRCVAFSPDGRTLVSGAWDKTIKIWDFRSGEMLRTIIVPSEGVWSVAFSPDGNTLASGSEDHLVGVWNLRRSGPPRLFKGHSDFVRSVAISSDGRILASGSYDKTIRLWNIENGMSLQTLKGHKSRVMDVCFSPDGQTLASGAGDKTIKLWNVQSGALLQTLNGHLDLVSSVAFSPDGSKLASGSWDKTVRLWNTKNGENIVASNSHTDFLSSVAFSPDGRRLASGSYDHTVILWDAESGGMLNILEGHTAHVSSIAFSPDGQRLASGSVDGTIRIWDISEK